MSNLFYWNRYDTNIDNGTMIEIVLVLYGIAPEQSRAFVSLRRHIARLGVDYELVVYNNDTSLHIPDSAEYVAVNAEGNDMLARAYNYALQRAAREGRKWLLLLDDDTEVTAEYFEALNVFVSKTATSPEVVAAVPILKYGSLTISPERINPIMWYTRPITNAGIYRKGITAFNSLSLLSVEFVSAIGGFSLDYPLDMLDHWVYRRIAQADKSVEVLGVEIAHSLSLLDDSMSTHRLVGFLDAERRFVASELTTLHYVSYKIRLALRLLKQYARSADSRKTTIMIKALFSKR